MIELGAPGRRAGYATRGGSGIGGGIGGSVAIAASEAVWPSTEREARFGLADHRLNPTLP